MSANFEDTLGIDGDMLRDDVYSLCGPGPASSRRRLPVDRNSITHKFEIGSYDGYLTVGLFEDGTPGELFVTMNKQGSTLSGLMDSAAMLVRMPLQQGVPAKTIARFHEPSPDSICHLCSWLHCVGVEVGHDASFGLGNQGERCPGVARVGGGNGSTRRCVKKRQ
ncbi:MAG TPA: hypothetical protein VMV15_14735 [Candidatus Binataceae bacterium]|nr:hypothetical protein [Candidatus Binataceae bacterium]